MELLGVVMLWWSFGFAGLVLLSGFLTVTLRVCMLFCGLTVFVLLRCFVVLRYSLNDL